MSRREVESKDGGGKMEELRLQREKLRQEVMDAVLTEFNEQPVVVKPQPKKRWFFSKTRRYYGVCYWKDMHEAVVDGDGGSIIAQMAGAQAKDRKVIDDRGGIERGENFEEDETKGFFVGCAVKKANALDTKGRTPLALAVKEDREDLVDLLLSWQCNPNKPETERTAASPLFQAILADSPGVALRLADADANVDQANSSGLTPLMLACLRGDADIIELLIERDADVDKRDRAGWTPLHYAAVGGHVEAAELLLKAGASKKKKDLRGFTAKDFAAFLRNRAARLERERQCATFAGASSGDAITDGGAEVTDIDDSVRVALESFFPNEFPDPASYGAVEAYIEQFTSKLV